MISLQKHNSKYLTENTCAFIHMSLQVYSVGVSHKRTHHSDLSAKLLLTSFDLYNHLFARHSFTITFPCVRCSECVSGAS